MYAAMPIAPPVSVSHMLKFSNCEMEIFEFAPEAKTGFFRCRLKDATPAIWRELWGNRPAMLLSRFSDGREVHLDVFVFRYTAPDGIGFVDVKLYVRSEERFRP